MILENIKDEIEKAMKKFRSFRLIDSDLKEKEVANEDCDLTTFHVQVLVYDGCSARWETVGCLNGKKGAVKEQNRWNANIGLKFLNGCAMLRSRIICVKEHTERTVECISLS